MTEPLFDCQLFKRIEILLEEERGALLSGQPDRIEEVALRKQALIDELDPMDLQHIPELSGLREKAARNQTLLEGALDGIRHVAQRLKALRQAREGIGTYDAAGCKTELKGTTRRKLERRA